MSTVAPIQAAEKVPIQTNGTLPELLAPAGDWECAKAAVENGADAIYFGLDKFNARMRAHNFTEADLPRLMEFLHRRGVKGYVTFNTLIFENELADAEQYLRTIIAAGVDAAIVQDVGIARLIRSLSPDFPIHASTQMTITSAAGIEFARELGCNLVVLARECSIKEIEKMCPAAASSTPDPRPSTLPLEVFIHGALCVAYSGQCLTSEALGGRSANRGECAQACRMPYELLSDGQPVPLGDRRYLLSPQDLAGLEVLPELIRAGVTSLKIEGRLKSPEYVANITRIYRQALNGFESAPDQNSKIKSHKYDLEMAFSRGLHTGWFGGINNQQLVHARFGKKRGVFLGEVKKILRDGVLAELVSTIKAGDGIVFDAGKPEEKEEGGRVYEIKKADRSEKAPHATRYTQHVQLHFGRGDIDFTRIHVGDKLWKTSDPELDRRLRQSFAGNTPKFQRPIQIEIHGLAGRPLTLIARDELGHIVQLDSSIPLAKAEKQPLTTERLREQLGRLGGTPFRLAELKNQLSGEVLLPVSELNRLRREAAAALEQQRANPPRWHLNVRQASSLSPTHQTSSTINAHRAHQPPEHGIESLATNQPATTKVFLPLPEGEGRGEGEVPPFSSEVHGKVVPMAPGENSFHVRSSMFDVLSRRSAAKADRCSRAYGEGNPTLITLVRNLSQLEAALVAGVQTVYCDFENPKKYRDAVAIVRARKIDNQKSKIEIFVAPPRIFKTGEEWTLQQVSSCQADGYLIRNYDHLRFFANDRRVGDFSLNIANHLSADYFKNKFGLERVTASYDLNFQQLENLLQAAPPEWFEITIHQHMPMFHMEHCVFCAFLSSGTDYTNCGRPCDKHDARLRDRVGMEHPLKADVGCRNTVFNALAQTGAEYVQRMSALGVRNFRLEFLNETPEQVSQTIAKYRQLLRGEISGTQLWRELKLMNQLGVTRGQM